MVPKYSLVETRDQGNSNSMPLGGLLSLDLDLHGLRRLQGQTMSVKEPRTLGKTASEGSRRNWSLCT